MSDHDNTHRPAISLREVVKTFPGAAQPAVSGLSLDVAAGHLVALVGPSGCGKTTTLKMINRLIEPTEGTIEVLGADQRALAAHELRRQIGYVIQQVGLFPHHTIRRNIGAVPELLGWDKHRIAERCAELVELVGLDPDVLGRYPSELSGGQQQRVGVARALAADPPILLMDEPYSAVDPIVRTRLQDELLTLQARVRKTIVFVTHDIDEALKLADRVAVLNVGGVLEQYADPAELLAVPANEFVAEFLGRERGLRRLALVRAADVALVDGPIVERSATAADARAAAAHHGSDWFGVIDTAGALLGWADVAALDGAASVADVDLEAFVATVTPTTPLREVLDVIITSRPRAAAVVDDGRYVGLVTVEQVAGGLQ